VGLIAISQFVALATTSAQTTLFRFDELGSSLLRVVELRTGQAHLLYVAAETRSYLPGDVLWILWHVHWSAFGAMAVLVAIVLWSGRRLGLAAGYPPVSAACLLSAAIPYAVGAIVLADNAVTENAGWRLSLMLMSVLYGDTSERSRDGRAIYSATSLAGYRPDDAVGAAHG
jgi:hypothetical protein